MPFVNLSNSGLGDSLSRIRWILHQVEASDIYREE